MPGRPPALALAVILSAAALSGCIGDRRVVDGLDPAAGSPGDRAGPPETRAERYARGEYRRGFGGPDADRNAELCRLDPADADCVGRRF